MIIVYTGNGKGKTSAALGTALRSLGWDRRACIVQFIKGNKNTGEWQFLQKIPNTEIHQFFDDKKLSITEKSILGNPEYKKSCEKAWEFAKKIILDKKHDLVILDEICNSMYYDLVPEQKVLDFIRNNSQLIRDNSRMDVIFTGRYASKELVNLSDLTTEMAETKHPYKKGFKAKKGIDY